MRHVRKLWFVVTACVICLAVSGHAQDVRAYRGTVATPNGFLDDGVLVVENGKIRSVGKTAPAGVQLIDVGGIIFPGLIDLHDHLTWNIFPRWHPPYLFGNRYDWQVLPDYLKKMYNPQYGLVGTVGCEMERYAEVKAMVGGATSLLGSFSPDKNDPPRNACDVGLARNLDYASGLYPNPLNDEPVRYGIFPLEASDTDNLSILKDLDSGKLKAYVVHLAEGADASADREFKMFKARGLVHAGVVIIHGVALTEQEIGDLKDQHMGFVWSPHSNYELYGKTANVGAVKKNGVTLAIAPDWSPTGSFGSLAELQFAYHWNAVQTPRPFTDAELLDMVASAPARLAHVDDKIGSLAPNLYADFIVLRKGTESPANAVLDAPSGAVRLVVVGGRPLLGDPDLMKRLAPSAKLEVISSCGRQIALAIADDTGGESWAEITQKLTDGLKKYEITLASLEECH